MYGNNCLIQSVYKWSKVFPAQHHLPPQIFHYFMEKGLVENIAVDSLSPAVKRFCP